MAHRTSPLLMAFTLLFLSVPFTHAQTNFTFEACMLRYQGDIPSPSMCNILLREPSAIVTKIKPISLREGDVRKISDTHEVKMPTSFDEKGQVTKYDKKKVGTTAVVSLKKSGPDRCLVRLAFEYTAQEAPFISTAGEYQFMQPTFATRSMEDGQIDVPIGQWAIAAPGLKKADDSAILILVRVRD